MAKDLVVVFGATGNQGGSVAHTVLDDSELSSRYAVRAITRDINNPKAQALREKGAEVVAADLDDPSTLPAALKSATFLFALTTTQYDGSTRDVETRQAHALLSEALTQGIQYVIWSSMSHPFKISGGKLTAVAQFDVKAEIETYIRGLPLKSAFFAPASFMQNFYTHTKPRPVGDGNGEYVLANNLRGDTVLSLIDITEAGKWVGAILAAPEKYEGKFFAAAEGLYTVDQAVEILGKVSGKVVKHVQVPDEVFGEYLPEGSRDMLVQMNVLFREYGYYGEGTREKVEWARKQVRGELTGLEGFLRRTGFKIE